MAMTGAKRASMERCIDQCLEVVKLASRCADDCLKSENVAALRQCIGLCLDAVGVSGLCVEMMAADSRFAARTSELCAEVCAACADECDRHEGVAMKECADACRRCA
jgi:hypothetical protein